MPGQVSSSDPSKQIAITNNSGAAVVVLMPTTADSPASTGAAQLYDQNLALLSSVDGRSTIANSSTETFVLDQYYEDPVTHAQKYSTIYNLLVSTSDWYSPVANIGVMQDVFSDPPAFPPQTVTAEEASALGNAGLFYQTIAAYPTSALAKNYQQAMSGTLDAAGGAADGSPDSSANVASSITGGTNAFFQGTKQFKNVTLAGVVAMQTYYSAFPFVWAKYGNATYYLYSSDGKTTSFVGTIALSKPATLDPTAPNGGYTCIFAPAANPSDTTSVDVTSATKSLTYGNGLFVDDENADVPAIAVKGTFQILRFFTQKPADTQIIPVLTGTIDGSVCIGFDSPQKSDDKENSQFWDSLFHPKNSAEIFKSIMTIGGAIMTVFFFGQLAYGIYSKIRGALAAKEPTTAEMFKTQQDAFEKMLNDKIDTAVKKISNNQQEAPKDPEEAMQDIAEQRDVVADNQNAVNLEDGLKAQSESLETMAEFESGMSSGQLTQLESAAGKVQDSAQALNESTPETLSSVVSEQTTAFDGIRSDVASLAQDVSGTISQEASQSIQENSELSETLSENIENSEKISQEEAADDDPTADDPIVAE